jgi:hypothetical protein
MLLLPWCCRASAVLTFFRVLLDVRTTQAAKAQLAQLNSKFEQVQSGLDGLETVDRTLAPDARTMRKQLTARLAVLTARANASYTQAAAAILATAPGGGGDSGSGSGGSGSGVLVPEPTARTSVPALRSAGGRQQELLREASAASSELMAQLSDVEVALAALESELLAAQRLVNAREHKAGVAGGLLGSISHAPGTLSHPPSHPPSRTHPITPALSHPPNVYWMFT